MRATLSKMFNRTVGKAFANSNAKNLKPNKQESEIDEHKDDLNRLGNDFKMDISQQEDIPMKENQKFEKDAKLNNFEKIDTEYNPFSKDSEKNKTIISNENKKL